MRFLRFTLPPLCVLLAVATVLAPGSYLSTVLASFVETFSGTPPAPMPWHPSNWDVTIIADGPDPDHLWGSMHAGHGSDCSAPPSTHTVNLIADTVFICNNHLMTAMYAGYGAVYLTPDALIDFSQGTAVLKWDMSTLRTSARDWVDVVIMPFDENLQLNYNDAHQPKDAVHLEMAGGCDCFIPSIARNFNENQIPSDTFTNYDSVLTPSASRRDTFELDISRTHIKFGMPAYNLWWTNTDITPLTWTQGVIQLNHRSYNPDKACNFDGSCGPNTWHWGNVSISPAQPFTILRADRRYLNSGTPKTVNFPAPAPANAHLRFAGLGYPIKMSLDGGKTWQNPQIQYPINKTEQEEDFWTPIPAGTTSVMLQGTQWYGGDWIVHDISIWAPGSGGPPPATATPTSTPQSTATPSATATATATAIATKTVTPTPTSTPSSDGTQTITFDSMSNPNRPLSGQYPTGVIAWGRNNWWLSGPYGAFQTNSVSFNGAGPTSESIRFVTPRKLVQVDAFNGGNKATSVTLNCSGQPQKIVVLAPNQLSTITTGWSQPCTTVTIGSTNGWETNFNKFVIAN